MFDDGKTCASFHDNPGGLAPKEIEEGERKYGTNMIQINVPPIYDLIFKEVNERLHEYRTIIQDSIMKYC